MLSQAQLDAIFQTKEDRRLAKQAASQGKGTVFLRTPDGLESRKITKMGDYDFGQHDGKVGSVRRNSKGGTYRVPNGSRRYLSPFVYDEQPVVAYSLRK